MEVNVLINLQGCSDPKVMLGCFFPLPLYLPCTFLWNKNADRVCFENINTELATQEYFRYWRLWRHIITIIFLKKSMTFWDFNNVAFEQCRLYITASNFAIRDGRNILYMIGSPVCIKNIMSCLILLFILDHHPQSFYKAVLTPSHIGLFWFHLYLPSNFDERKILTDSLNSFRKVNSELVTQKYCKLWRLYRIFF